MKLLAIFITGAIAGVLGGMGMGGGTLLIPALTAIFGLDQKFSQTINLVSFIPMAAVALFIHAKNGLVRLKGTAVLGVSAMIFSVGASFLEKLIHGSVQKKIFGLLHKKTKKVFFFAERYVIIEPMKNRRGKRYRTFNARIITINKERHL